MRALAVVSLALLVLVAPGVATAASPIPPIHHVWVVELENESYQSVLGKDTSYLSTTVRHEGEVLTSYYATGHASLDNYVSQVSGQEPNVLTQADCPDYINVTPGVLVSGGQALGEGCVYPSTVLTIADQLQAAHLTWKGYMGDMGNVASRDHTDAAGACGHPIFNSSDGTQIATAKDQYATRHDPFMYFHSIIDSKTACDNVVPLTRLPHDLATAATTPNYTWITPNLCDDGHDATCAGVNVKGGKEGGLTSTNLWLEQYLPMIMASPAYKADGMIIVTWDESETSDAASCCGEAAGPGSPLPGIGGLGGGHIATLILSKFVQPGSTNATPYNHYSMLRSVEDIFGLSHLGAAGASGLKAFGSDVYNAPKTTAAPSTAGGGASGASGGSGASSPAPVPTGQLPLTGGLGWPAAATGALGLAAAAGVSRRRRVRRQNL